MPKTRVPNDHPIVKAAREAAAIARGELEPARAYYVKDCAVGLREALEKYNEKGGMPLEEFARSLNTSH